MDLYLLKKFLKDPKRPFGANNLLMPDVAMPNVLEPLAGEGLFMVKTTIYLTSC